MFFFYIISSPWRTTKNNKRNKIHFNRCYICMSMSFDYNLLFIFFSKKKETWKKNKFSQPNRTTPKIFKNILFYEVTSCAIKHKNCIVQMCKSLLVDKRKKNNQATNRRDILLCVLTTTRDAILIFCATYFNFMLFHINFFLF